MNIDIPEKISAFIKKHHVLTLATSFNNKPWCCNCFYAYIEDEQLLVFTSEEKTRHVGEALANPEISGSIVLETTLIGKIQGLQFEGFMFRPEGAIFEKAKKLYLKRFPYARLILAELWCVRFSFLKYTDNTLGFGKKLTWPSRPEKNDK